MDILRNIVHETRIKPETADWLSANWEDLENESKIIYRSVPGIDQVIKWVLIIISRIIPSNENWEKDLDLLFDYLENNFATLDPFDTGIYWHLKGYREWKTDRSLSRALTLLNRSCETLDSIPSDKANQYRARVSNTFGQIYYALGHVEDAVKDFSDSLTRREKGTDLYGRALTLGNLGRLHMDLGNCDEAVHYLEEDLDIIKEHFPSEVPVRIQLLSHLGRCHLESGRTEQASNNYQASLDLSEKNNNPTGVVFACLGLGEVEASRKNFAEAEIWCERVLKTIRQHFHDREEQVFLGMAMHLQGIVQFGNGELKQAIQSLNTARDIVLGLDRISPVQKARLLTDSARVSEATGDKEQTSEFLRLALTWLDKTSLFQRRQEIESKLKNASSDRWLLHSAMRFTGKDVETLLERTGEQGFKGERNRVSVLFTDIRDFTKIAERMTPEEVIGFLNSHLTRMIRTVDYYGGYVDKILGDALMAVFSIPDLSLNDPERAALTSLVMLEELKRLNAGLPKEIPPIRAGLGLNYGMVVSGLIGSARKRSYTVIGDVVNVASRLESLTKELQIPILVSDSFRNAFKNTDRFLWMPVGNWILYGREESLAVYSLSGEDMRDPVSTTIKERISTAEEGFHYYYKREFRKAQKYFRILTNSGEIHPFQALEKKCEEYWKNPPYDSWNGSLQMYRK